MTITDFLAPTPHSDPESYLSSLKFNRRLNRCPRTNLTVTFSDVGDAEGVPLVYVLPSGCSRWIAAPMDPLAKSYGVRMIVVDRPGCGGTGEVPLVERIERSCEMIVSVLEHLNIKPAHVLATSAGIYYALHLLTYHPSAFQTGLNPPPRIYLISPWSPLLPPDHEDHWPFKWSWVPTPLIATQHYTTPHLIKAAQGAQQALDTGVKVYETGRSYAMKWFKALTEDPPTPSTSSTSLSPSPASSPPSPIEKTVGYASGSSSTAGLGDGAAALLRGMTGGIGEGTDVPVPETGTKTEQAGETSTARRKYWGKFPCCVACTTSEYMTAENGQGIGQEHLICLNRGPIDTGAKWLETATSDLAATIEFAQLSSSNKVEKADPHENRLIAGDTQRKEVPHPLMVDVWWGWEDDMVPRKGQLWFNLVVGAFPGCIDLRIHDVPDGDHTDLLARVEGIHEVMAMVQSQGNTTLASP
ncbi:hypothetical protein IAR55_003433 [Kwoniella newhampshirensis]|uniref:AB hydrolase-1 domain-containing protein n=1 Tax=Kwoniella newhampshirensis TaxID=1651941 RepID=A0AAW0YRN8_9TREE